MSHSRPIYVLDSCAMLAYLNGEPGMPRIRQVLDSAGRGECRAAMSLINLGEVLYIVEREVSLAQAQTALAAVEQLPLDILLASREAVLAAAHIKANYRLSYADAFAVAVAQELAGTILTSDPEFTQVEGMVQVEWLESKA